MKEGSFLFIYFYKAFLAEDALSFYSKMFLGVCFKLDSGSTLTCQRMAAISLLIFIPETVEIISAVKLSKANLENTLPNHK